MSSVQEIWHPAHGSAAKLLRAALPACEHGDYAPSETILHFLRKRGHESRQPVAVLTGNAATLCIYHKGHEYDVYALGEPESILRLCRMSENDREKALLESRRLGGGEATVVSFASGTLQEIPKRPQAVKGLEFCGHIAVT